jgi:hypothetical protein
MVLVEPVAATHEPAQQVKPSRSEDSAPPQHNVPSSHVAPAPADFEDATRLFDDTGEPLVPNTPDLTETVEDLSVQAEATPRTRESRINSEDSSDWKGDSEEIEPEELVTSELSPPPLPASDEILLPNADWTSVSTAHWRNRILTGMAAVVGVVLAVMLLFAFSGDQTSSVVSRPTTAEEMPAGDVEPVPPEQLESAEQQEERDGEVPSTAANTNAGHASQSTDDATDTGPDSLPGAVSSADSSVPPIGDSTELPAPDAPQEDVPPGITPPAASAPRTDEPPGLTPKESAPDPVATGDALGPLAEAMREFKLLLEKTEEPVRPLPASAAELSPESAADESEAEPVARRSGPRVVELEERLSDPVAKIEFDGVPLINFLRFVSDYSTIPITLDADILRWMRVSPTTAVHLRADNTTVVEVLKQGLAPLRLEHRIESDQLFVTRRPKDETGRRTVPFKVEDLVGEDTAQLQQLVTHIMDFAAPESWSSRGGDGTITFRGSELIIEQHETVQFEVLEFCEKLRVARGLKTRSPYDPAMFRLATRRERVRAKLAQSITLTYIRPAPLQRIVDRIAETAKLNILIDWRTLAEAGWGPDAEVRFSVADQPVVKALVTLLEPMDLAYRIVDESTLQVTTPAVLDSRLELEFYRVPKLADDGAQLVQSAHDALGQANFRDFGGGGQLVFDRPSGCLLASLSQSRQQELQAWLSARLDAATADTATTSASGQSATPTTTAESRIVPASGRASSD